VLATAAHGLIGRAAADGAVADTGGYTMDSVTVTADRDPGENQASFWPRPRGTGRSRRAGQRDAQQHANNATQAAQAGNLAGSYAEMMAAIDAAKAGAVELHGVSNAAGRDGDPNAQTAGMAAGAGYGELDNLATQAATENAGASSGGGGGGESDSGGP
jgi:hypothetical protein